MKMKLRGGDSKALSKPWEVSLYKDGEGCVDKNLVTAHKHSKANEESDFIKLGEAKFIKVTGEGANVGE